MKPDPQFLDLDETEQFSHAVHHIYDAALDAERWTDALQHSCIFLRCGGGAMGSFDLLRIEGALVTSWGFAREYAATMAENMKTNPLARTSLRIKAGEVNAVSDFMPYEEFIKTQTYIEWAEPQGIIDVMQTLVDKTPLSAVVMGFSRFREHGLVDDDARRRMKLLAPHLRRSVQIGKTLDSKRVEATALIDTIDGLSAGVFLVDADSHLIHVNKSGSAMLELGFLKTAGGVLCAADLKANRLLRDTIVAATQGDTLMSAQGTAIGLTARSGERFNANVLPLASGRRRAAGNHYSASAAIFVHTTTPNFPGPVKTAMHLHGLTDGETRVLFALLEMQSVPAAATLLGLSQTTVKTHLRNLFRKTGARNQADVTKLIAGYVSPLR